MVTARKLVAPGQSDWHDVRRNPDGALIMVAADNASVVELGFYI